MKSCRLPLPPLVVLLSVLLLHASKVQTSFGFISNSIAPISTKTRTSIAAKKVVAEEAIRDKKEVDDVAKENGKKSKIKSTTTKTKRKKKSTEPSHWHDENDPFIIVANQKVYAPGLRREDSINEKDNEKQSHSSSGSGIDNNRKSIKFTIRGNPRVLIRHRTARGFMYNPSRATQDAFRDCLLGILPREHHPTILDDVLDDGEDDDGSDAVAAAKVLFAEQDFLKLSITFRMKRPLSHFISSKRAIDRLKPTAPGKLSSSIRSDVDNLAKFVMDSLNGLLYVDDRQVVRLDAIKVLDSEGLCQGATEVEIGVLEEEDL